MNIDPKYKLYPVFLYLKTGDMKCVLFDIDGVTHLYGYHKFKPIDLIVKDKKILKDYQIVKISPLFEEFMFMQDNNPNLDYKGIVRNTQVNIHSLPKEILKHIGSKITKLKDIHSFSLTEKRMNEAIKNKYTQELKSWYDNNELRKLLKKFPLKKWNFFLLSSNPNINSTCIRNFPRTDWDGNNLSSNPGITFEDIKNISRIKWNWNNVQINPNITMEIIENNPNEKWDYHILSRNPNLTIEFIMKHRNEDWDWRGVSETIPLTLKIIAENDIPWEIKHFDRNKYLTMDIIEKYNHNDWSWFYITINKNIDMQFALKYKHKIWFNMLSNNPNITFADVLANPKLEWDNANVSMNINVTPKIIEDNPTYRWNYYNGVSRNPNINMKFVIDHIEENWSITNLSTNPGIKPEELIKQFPNSSTYLSDNPNLTLKFVKDHPEIEWDWSKISYNKFNINL